MSLVTTVRGLVSRVRVAPSPVHSEGRPVPPRRVPNVTDEVIAQYIEKQQHEEDAEFRVEGEDGPMRPPKPSA